VFVPVTLKMLDDAPAGVDDTIEIDSQQISEVRILIRVMIDRS